MANNNFFSQLETQSYANPVTIAVNEETVTLTEGQYRGKSVSQLVAEYASHMIDVARVTRYVVGNEQVSGDTVIRPGETIRVSVNSEAKG
jgi:hypothetical protein